jgi:type IV pilus assembly protein PilZ
MDNKRQHSRVAKRVKSEVHSPDGMTFSKAVDLSKGGIFISTPDPLKPGSNVELVVHIPGQEPVTIKGTIKWTRDDETSTLKAGMGIEFSDLSEKESEALKKVL